MAQDYAAAGDIVAGALRKHLSQLTFGATTAGRDHAGHGESLRDALSNVAAGLQEWSRACAEISAVLGASADRYDDADAAAAARLG